MKRTLITGVLLLAILLSGCTQAQAPADPADSASASPSSVPSPSPRLTYEDVVKNIMETGYAGNVAVGAQAVGEDFMFVEIDPVNYRLYDLRDGSFEHFHEYGVTNVEIVSENCIIFDCDGTSEHSAMDGFPYRAVRYRIYGVGRPADAYAFGGYDEPVFHELNEPVSGGMRRDGVIFDLNVTFSGIEVMFGPTPDDDGQFAAVAAWILPTATSCDAESGLFTVTIKASGADGGVPLGTELAPEGHCYIESCAVAQGDGEMYITLELTEAAEKYMIDVHKAPANDGMPYFSLQFTDGGYYY